MLARGVGGDVRVAPPRVERRDRRRSAAPSRSSGGVLERRGDAAHVDARTPRPTRRGRAPASAAQAGRSRPRRRRRRSAERAGRVERRATDASSRTSTRRRASRGAVAGRRACEVEHRAARALAAKRRAIAAPMPFAPPVTSAGLAGERLSGRRPGGRSEDARRCGRIGRPVDVDDHLVDAGAASAGSCAATSSLRPAASTMRSTTSSRPGRGRRSRPRRIAARAAISPGRARERLLAEPAVAERARAGGAPAASGRRPGTGSSAGVGRHRTSAGRCTDRPAPRASPSSTRERSRSTPRAARPGANGDAERVELLPQPAGADAEPQPAAADDVERRGLLGEDRPGCAAAARARRCRTSRAPSPPAISASATSASK